MMQELHAKVDALIERIDQSKQEAEEFKAQYEKQLDDKDRFYKEQSYYDTKSQRDARDKKQEAYDLPAETLLDIEYGADNLRVALKEKYLGRLPGMKRGESSVAYNSTTLTLIMSASMICILVYIQRQVAQ